MDVVDVRGYKTTSEDELATVNNVVSEYNNSLVKPKEVQNGFRKRRVALTIVTPKKYERATQFMSRNNRRGTSPWRRTMRSSRSKRLQR